MNLKGRLKQLQTAIIKKGIVIKVNSNQFYSEDQGRCITSYRVVTPISKYNEYDDKWEIKDYEILKTCSMPDVILCLADIYKAVRNWNSP